MNALGLRERNKIKRRAAIVEAALELFAQRSYDKTTIADIAEAAEIAPRTVSIYFPAKQDIALAGVTDIAERLADRLEHRRPGESMVDGIEDWLRAELTEMDPRHLELLRRMFDANPELRALSTARLEAISAEGARIVAEEFGDTPEGPRARIAMAAIGALVEQVLTTPTTRDAEETAALAIRFLRAGFASLRDA